MSERRSLIQGLKATPPAIDPKLENQFVYAGKSPDQAAKTPAATPTQKSTRSRVPISTRIRSDFAAALKRASLERQLEGQGTSSLQDILEQAIEPWLKSNGYID
jgi:hypothetical protein